MRKQSFATGTRKGVMCISIDTELLWGRKDLDYTPFIERTKKEREIIKKLLILFRKYDIPATWAIVGKLYESGDELWSGKDIIQMIKKTPKQEIASHSYSHEDFTKISTEKAQEEFSKNKQYSFVFPRNHIAHINLLKKNGFKTYRGPDETNTTSNILQLISLVLGLPPKTHIPNNENGIINTPGSMYFVSARGLRKYIFRGMRYRRAKRGIEQAIARKEVFHIWFHPVDLADQSEKLFYDFEQILIFANKKREQGVLEVKTMEEIARQLLK